MTSTLKSYRNRINTIAIFWGFAVLLLLANVLPFGDAVNNTNGKGIGIRLDYVFHGLGCLMLPLTLVFGKPNPSKIRNMYLLFTILYVCCLELIQIFIPYRSYNNYDLMYNVIGVMIGVFITIGFSK